MTLFINKSSGGTNNDLKNHGLASYLDITEGFESSFPEFHVSNIKGFNVIDESKACDVGFKARAAEFFIQELIEQGVKELVYVQPRRGFAGISLSWLAKKYDLDLTLIMPASKEISDHQALCIEYGAKPLFQRIAAMPNANRAAEIYAAADSKRFYIPLGLNHPLVTAGAVRAFHDFFLDKPQPDTMWTVISTGVLSRSLQIALPKTKFHAIAVSRNIQPGELGRAEFHSYHRPFNRKSDVIPTEFDCENSYDSKGWDIMTKLGKPGDWFFSVAGEAPGHSINKTEIKSYRDWGDNSDFDKEGITL